MASVERLFSQTFLVRFKSSSALDDRKSSLNISVELHSASPSRKELFIQLTDDDDLFFLHTLTLGEEDFHVLKSQQDLLVDFGDFPQKLIDLLRLCASEEGKSTPKFILELVSSSRSASTSLSGSAPFSLLKLIETNPFKNLEHLSLKLVSGTDADVKRHLAFKLKALRETLSSDSDAFSRRELELKERLQTTEDQLSTTSARLEELTLQSQEEKTRLTSTLQRDLLAEKERVGAVRDECHRHAESERKAIEAERLREKKQSDARVTNLEAANRELTDRRYANEAAIRELKSKVHSLENDLERTTNELSTQRKTNVAVDNELRLKEKECDALSHKFSRCEEEIRDKEKVLQRSSDLLTEERRKCEELEAKFETGAAKEKKLEKYVKSLSDEVKKGNEIIKRLQDNLKSGDAKLKLRNQIAQEQEKTLQEKTEALEAIKAENQILKTGLEEKTAELKELKLEVDERTKELTDAKAKIEKNENLINWLNKQATEKQLYGAGVGGGSSGVPRLSPNLAPIGNINNNYINNHASASSNAANSSTPFTNGYGARSLPSYPYAPHHPEHHGPPHPVGRPPTAPAALGQRYPSTSDAASVSSRRTYEPSPIPHSAPPRAYPHPRMSTQYPTMPSTAPLPLPGNGPSVRGVAAATLSGTGTVIPTTGEGERKSISDTGGNGVMGGEGIDSIYLQPAKSIQPHESSGKNAPPPVTSRVNIQGMSGRAGTSHNATGSRAGVSKKPAAPSSYFPQSQVHGAGKIS